MKMKAEIIASVIPSVRAEIARELVSTHGISQQTAAEMLGVSQPAISQYVRQMRGARRQEDFVRKGISEICGKLVRGSRTDLESDIYNLCKMIAENKINK